VAESEREGGGVMETLLPVVLLLLLALFFLLVASPMMGLNGKLEAYKIMKEMTELPPGTVSAEIGPLVPKGIHICRTGPYIICDDDIKLILESAPDGTKYITVETVGRTFKAQTERGGIAEKYVY
jgi:hypothetical protein